MCETGKNARVCKENVLPKELEEAEYFDLYDAYRHKNGRKNKRGGRLQNDEYHLNVALCIFNKSGEMLIQQRQSFKSTWPGLWDISVDGNVISGETTQDAVKRELKEELGVSADFSKERPYLTLNYEEGFTDVFFLTGDIDSEALSLQPEEVAAVCWAGRDKIIQMIENGEFIPYFPSMIDLLFDMNKAGRYGYLKAEGGLSG